MSDINSFPSRQTVERIRNIYKAGTVVVLDHMTDIQAPPTGTFGVVEFVDDIGTAFVRWSTGSGLGVAYGEDSIHPASAHEEALYKIQCESKIQHDGSRCPRCGEVMPGGLHTHALSRRVEIIICDKCGQEEAIEDAAQAGIFKNSKPPKQIEDWYVCTKCGGGGYFDMPEEHKEKKGFHIVATEVLDDDNNVQGYSIGIPEYPEASAFCVKPEDIIQTGWEAKEKAAAENRKIKNGD